jgi:hypothetical protein
LAQSSTQNEPLFSSKRSDKTLNNIHDAFTSKRKLM